MIIFWCHFLYKKKREQNKYRKNEKIKKFKKGKPIFKQIIISTGEMKKFEKDELKKERKIVKISWFDWLINSLHKPIKKFKAILMIKV